MGRYSPESTMKVRTFDMLYPVIDKNNLKIDTMIKRIIVMLMFHASNMMRAASPITITETTIASTIAGKNKIRHINPSMDLVLFLLVSLTHKARVTSIKLAAEN